MAPTPARRPATHRSLAVQAAARAPGVALSAEQLALVRRTIAQGATDDELALYLYDCQRHGVHPLDKLLHFTKRGGKYVPITSIDLMRTRAAETGDCLGISDAYFTGTPQHADFAATVTVRRLVQGQTAEFTATARWAEYYPGQGPPGIMWRKMPHGQLGKCAEGLALRKGFPKQLAGLYAREEMDQAPEGESTADVPPAPTEPPPAPAETPASAAEPEPWDEEQENGHADEDGQVPIDPTDVLQLGREVDQLGGKGTAKQIMIRVGLSTTPFLDLSPAQRRTLHEALCDWLDANTEPGASA
jgi:phage recombination protein Bet